MKLARGIYRSLITVGWLISLMMSDSFAQPYAYVAGYSSQNVYVVDMATNVISQTLAIGGTPRGIAITPDRSKVYVAQVALNRVTVLDGNTNNVIDTIAVGDEPYSMAITPDGSRLYVVNGLDGTVSEINTVTDAVVSTFTVWTEDPADPDDGVAELTGIAISPDGTDMLVTVRQRFGNEIVRVDPSTNTVIDRMDPGDNYEFYGVVFSPDGTRAYVAMRARNRVRVLDMTTFTTITDVGTGRRPSGVAITADGSKVYSADRNDGTVSVINTATNTITHTLTVGAYCWGAATSPDGSYVYTADRNANTITVISTATDNVIGTIPGASSAVGFGNFTGAYFGGSNPAPFPVELIQFDAQPRGDAVYLSWQTGSELNNDRFQVQRSLDSESWEAIGEIPGYGNSQTVQSYQFTDHYAQPGQPYYYRLKQIDFDGKSSFSPRVSTTIPLQGQTRLFVEAKSEQLRITHTGAQGELMDLSGRSLRTFAVQPGETRVSLHGLPVGMYLLRLTHPNGWIETHKLLK